MVVRHNEDGGDHDLVGFIRTPIIGTLTWIMGGQDNNNNINMNSNHNEGGVDLLHDALQNMMIEEVVEEEDHNMWQPMDAINNSNPTTKHTNDGMSERHAPPLVQSDVSVRAPPASDNDGNTTLFEEPLLLLSNKKPKKMSWSDNLVEYMDESVRHEPSASVSNGSPSSSSCAKPKSSITRTSSVRSSSLSGSATSASSSEERRKIRYLPNGMDRAHNGLVMPTRPFGMGQRDPAGESSPQYGWYVNITPPTPEMYYSRSHIKPGLGIERDGDGSSSASSGDSATRGPNRVFQNLKGSNSSRPPMGWPSVPL